MNLHPRTAALMAKFEALPGVDSITAMTRGRAPRPLGIRYRVLGKIFVLLSFNPDDAHVVLKCDPHMIEILKEQYAGVGHRTHLDHRHWIAIQLDGDVPEAEVDRLALAAYDLVRATLTRKEQAELAKLSPAT